MSRRCLIDARMLFYLKHFDTIVSLSFDVLHSVFSDLCCVHVHYWRVAFYIDIWFMSCGCLSETDGLSLPDELNYFYARFEASNTEACMRACSGRLWLRSLVADVSKTLKQVNYKDVYSERALTSWQVSSLTFSTCPWTESVIQTCFKQTAITVPKKTKVT
jgi:hypothetical protein